MPPVSKQAFSKARMRLNPEYVRGFFDDTAEIAASDETLDSYKGMRLIVFDGSDIALENTRELRENFGVSGPGKGVATALSSIAYGPLDHVIYDCRIDKYKKNERDLAKLHIEKLCELGLCGSLILTDRGYPSIEFIAYLLKEGFHFVMRVKAKWNLEADSIKTQGIISLTYHGVTFPVRVIKILLPTGEVETLLTSLDEQTLPHHEAGELYFNRWSVETSFDLIKNKLQLENFSGKTEVSVKQDFYATMYLANMVAFVAGEADDQICISDKPKRLKHRRQASRNRTIHKLRKDFLCLVMEPNPLMRDAMLDRIVRSVAQRPVSIVPDRSPPRKSPRKKPFYMARKSVV